MYVLRGHTRRSHNKFDLDMSKVNVTVTDYVKKREKKFTEMIHL